MSRRRGGGWPINSPYPAQNPHAYTPNEPDPDETVPVSDVQQEAVRAFAEAETATRRWLDSPLGKVWMIIVGIFGILITISLGILVLAGIWGVIWS